MTQPKLVWQDALPSEIEFWRKWLSTGGLQWPADFSTRLDPDAPLQTHVFEYLRDLPQTELSILDVGAGPLTLLGKRWPGKEIRITAVDPLADAYDQLLAECNLSPPVRTTWCHGELLPERFRPNTFDLVWAQNSLDHSYDPVQIIHAALSVVKVGRHVVLTHDKNEGASGNYEGLHQWNFDFDRGDFVVWSPKTRINLTKAFSAYASVVCTDLDTGVLAEITKIAEPPLVRAPKVEPKPIAISTEILRLLKERMSDTVAGKMLGGLWKR